MSYMESLWKSPFWNQYLKNDESFLIAVLLMHEKSSKIVKIASLTENKAGPLGKQQLITTLCLKSTC